MIDLSEQQERELAAACHCIGDGGGDQQFSVYNAQVYNGELAKFLAEFSGELGRLNKFTAFLCALIAASVCQYRFNEARKWVEYSCGRDWHLVIKKCRARPAADELVFELMELIAKTGTPANTRQAVRAWLIQRYQTELEALSSTDPVSVSG